MATSRRATGIVDVAEQAGVSPATVSRVMNGRFSGDPSVAARVHAAAEALSYTPNHTARSLALGQTHAVAFVVPDLSNPAFQAVLTGLSKTAARDGYRVLVADSEESPNDEPMLVREIRRRCDAVILGAPRMSESELALLATNVRPLVLINRNVPGTGVPSLSIDYRTGIAQLARHLYDHGHRKLAYVEGPPHSASNRQRLAGLEDFLGEVGDVDLARVQGGVSSEDGAAAARAAHETGATGMLAFNDLVAVGLMNGLSEHGIRVPHDVSVTGFDDIPFARFIAPPLTTASVRHAELGAAAWARMRALLAGEQPGMDAHYAPHVEVRGSTAPTA